MACLETLSPVLIRPGAVSNRTAAWQPEFPAHLVHASIHHLCRAWGPDHPDRRPDTVTTSTVTCWSVLYHARVIREQLLNPDAADLAAFLNRHTRACECLVQVAGQAEVTYQGRAASTAEAGSYLLIIKCDGSLQIHHPKGIKPMNWQPKTDNITAAVEDGYCVLTASRKSPAETVRVVMLDIHLAQALEIKKEAGFLLAGSEAQLQATLARQPELIEDGLKVLDRELLSGVGDMDLYAQDLGGRYVVVELKRSRATQEAVHQLSRYVQAVRAFLPTTAVVRGILAAPGISAPAARILEGLGLEFKEIHALPSAQETAAQPGLFAAASASAVRPPDSSAG